MTLIVTEEQKVRIAGQVMANLIRPHTEKQEIEGLAVLAVKSAEAIGKAFKTHGQRIGPMK